MINLGINKPIKDTKLAVAMSGGVDSSVVAAMLKISGYDVVGFTMRLYNQTDKVNSKKSCCAGKDINDAINTAKQFDFPHYTLDYQESFYNNVINDFVETYEKGKTPIPCIKCNQTVKFTDMLNEARKIKADALVTGHYAKIVNKDNNRKLYKAIDKTKDQSYFLFATTKKQLDYLYFPLGNFNKEKVRNIAKELKLKVQDKPDSQDICFVTEGSYASLIQKLKPESFISGNITNKNNEIIGQHNGIINYTVGQRKKIGIGGNIKPLYVIEIDSIKNKIIVGNKEELKKSKVLVNDLNWISDDVKDGMSCEARIKSDQTPTTGVLKLKKNDHIEFEFSEPQISIAPGQACVFYKDEEVLGGGWIIKKL